MKKIVFVLIIAISAAQAGFFDSVMQTVTGSTSSTESTTVKENQGLIDSVKKETGLSTTQSIGALGTLLGYASNKASSSDYNKVTSSVPGLSSLTSISTISPIISSLTSSEMVQTSLKSFGVDPSMVTTIVPILVNYVSNTGGKESGGILSNALSGLLK